jgi:DNA-directed RNA polymerase subunit omega
MKQALAKVGNPNVLVNIISRRVRQLTSGGSRPLIADIGGLGVADIALLEIVEGKMAWDVASEESPEEGEAQTSTKKRRRS